MRRREHPKPRGTCLNCILAPRSCLLGRLWPSDDDDDEKDVADEDHHSSPASARDDDGGARTSWLQVSLQH